MQKRRQMPSAEEPGGMEQQKRDQQCRAWLERS